MSDVRPEWLTGDEVPWGPGTPVITKDGVIYPDHPITAEELAALAVPPGE